MRRRQSAPGSLSDREGCSLEGKAVRSVAEGRLVPVVGQALPLAGAAGRSRGG